MRVVTGTVVSSSRVSLSKAAVILARFAEADTAAPLEVAAYVRRASAAFDELADFHQEIKLSRKRAESETYKEEHSEEEEEEEGKKKKKKKKRKRGTEGEERSNLSDGGIAMREIGVVGDGNLVMENERRKKKRKKEAKEEERYGFEVEEENNGRVEEERHEERKKKKKKGDLDEEERYTYKKNKNHLDIGKEQGELVDQSEQHKKKKKKRKKSEAED